MGTSVPGSDVPHVGVPHVDKLVHFASYAIFGWLLARALGRATAGRLVPGRASWRAIAGGIGVVAALGAADEWHQRWIPGREADLLDWYADLTGGTIALLLAARHVPRPEPIT